MTVIRPHLIRAIVALGLALASFTTTASIASATGSLTQTAPTSGIMVNGYQFTNQLATYGQIGNVTFLVPTSILPTGVAVSSSGLVTSDGTTPVGNYTFSGTMTDDYGDFGTWTYDLQVQSAPTNTITQPYPSTMTFNAGIPASYQVETTGYAGPETFYVTSTLPTGLAVSPSGYITSDGTILPGHSYPIQGYATDTYGDVGAWNASVTFVADGLTITQSTPTSATVDAGSNSSIQLVTTGQLGTETFTVTSALPTGVSVSSSGLVTSGVTSLPGIYTLSGTDTDTYGSTGTWSFTLTVHLTMVQLAPFGGSTPAGVVFHDQINITGSNGYWTFFQSPSDAASNPTGVSVNSQGQLTSDGTTPPGVYNLIGEYNDPSGTYSSFWEYTLTVTTDGVTIAQSSPSGATVAAGSSFTSTQLVTTGQHGTETFAVLSALPTGVAVSPSGAVTTNATTPPGVYALSGTDSDTFGGSGTWSFTLNVGIAQSAPTSAIFLTSITSSIQLVTAGQQGTETFAVTSALPVGVSVSPSGLVTSDGTTPVGVYHLSGTTSDSVGTTGTWSLALTMTAGGGTITQNNPVAAVTTVDATSSTQLVTTGQLGTETFTVTSALPVGVSVSPSGLVSSATTTPAGVYALSGTTSDTYRGTGTWSFTLTVHAIVQSAPTTATVALGEPWNYQLVTTGQHGTETFTVTSALPYGVSVSSSGLVSSGGLPLYPGVYTLSGTTSDSSGGTGTWSFTFTEVILAQLSPFSGTTTAGSPYSVQLVAVGGGGYISFTWVPTVFWIPFLPPGISISSSGLVTSNGTTPMGVYTLSGTTSNPFTSTSNPVDPLEAPGTWSFTLTVGADGVTITQSAPTTATATAGSPSSTQLITTGQLGTETFAVTSKLPTGVSVSSSGLVTSDGTTPVGVYHLSGTTSDTFGGTGTWLLTLTVGADGVTITQSAPTTGQTTFDASSSTQLVTTGQSGIETFVVTSTLPAGVSVSPSGLVTSDGTTPVGVYTLSGTDSDTFGGAGTWSLAFTVTIAQTAPTTALVLTGATSSTQLVTTGQQGTETFTVSSALPAGVSVSPSGLVTCDGSTPVGVYHLSGTTADSFGDTGTWSFTLTVAIAQSAPTTATATASQTSRTQLVTTGQQGTEAFTVSSALPAGVAVSSSGLVTTDGTTPVGVYHLTGTEIDSFGNTGAWSFTLTVSADGVTIAQSAPTIGTAIASQSARTQLVTTGQLGTETFTVTSALPAGVSVSPSGLVSSNGTTPVGKYTISGTTSDSFGGTGTWSLTLTVGPDGVTIAQATPTTATATASQTSRAQLVTTGQLGTETFVVSSTLPAGVAVSSSGLVTSDGTTPVGVYHLSGTTSDTFGGSGTWSLTLTVGPDGVTIAQSTPTSDRTTVGSTSSIQVVTGDQLGTETFAVTSALPAGVAVSSSGLVTTNGTTPVGVYHLSGTTSDTFGGTGTWSLTLTVVLRHVPITQLSPITASVTAGQSSSTQLVTTGQQGTETFAVTSALPAGVAVSSSGLVTSNATTPVGAYHLSGATADSLGDTGTWNFTLTVGATTITQSTPFTASVTAGKSSSTQLVTTGQLGTETFSVTSPVPAGVSTSSNGLVTSDATTPVGVYHLSGTTGDSFGDTGTWSFTLTVSALDDLMMIVSPPRTTSTSLGAGVLVKLNRAVTLALARHWTIFEVQWRGGTHDAATSRAYAKHLASAISERVRILTHRIVKVSLRHMAGRGNSFELIASSRHQSRPTHPIRLAVVRRR